MIDIQSEFIDLDVIGRITRKPEKKELIFFDKNLVLIRIFKFQEEEDYYKALNEIKQEIYDKRRKQEEREPF